jgi:hypothetical protein
VTGTGGQMAQSQFKPGNQLKVTFEISLSGRLFTGFSQNGTRCVFTRSRRCHRRTPRPGETAQRARTGILVRTVSLRASAGPETSHG